MTTAHDKNTHLTDEHDLGLSHDLRTLMTRRRALGLLAVAGAAGATAGCDSLPFVSRSEAEVIATGKDGRSCVVHPEETAGPFPADGSNRSHGTLANVLKDSGIVRRDMRGNLDRNSASVAGGVELALKLKIVAVTNECAPLAGHAIYLWHCDAEGRYSIYDLPNASYLRAVGVSNDAGEVEFLTIIPGCYRGRYPHIHFEVYPNLTAETDYRNRILTSQLAIPADVCKRVYDSAAAYRTSIANFANSPSLERDGIFADNTPKQLAAQTLAMTPRSANSYDGTVTVGLNTSKL